MSENLMLAIVGGLVVVSETAIRLTRMIIASRRAKRAEAARAVREAATS